MELIHLKGHEYDFLECSDDLSLFYDRFLASLSGPHADRNRVLLSGYDINKETVYSPANMELSDSHVLQMCQLLRKWKKLEKLDISSNLLLYKSVYALAVVLPILSNFKHLILSKQKLFGSSEIQAISANLIPSLKHQLVTLDLSNLQQIQSEEWHPIISSLGKCTKLEVLNLSTNDLKLDSAKELCTLIQQQQQLQQLKTLNLGFNLKLGTEAALLILSAIKDLPQLEEVHLNYCKISDDGAKRIAQLFEQGSLTIKVLNFAQNEFAKSGTTLLLETLVSSKFPMLKKIGIKSQTSWNDTEIGKLISELAVHHVDLQVI